MEPDTALQLATVIGLYREWRRVKGCRQYGVHPLNAQRKEVGQFHTTMGQLKQDEERFRQYTRMSIGAFDKLVQLVGHRLDKRSAREALSPEERLVVCLRFLSTGDTFHSLGINFRIGVSTACNVCHEVCKALVEELAPVYLRTPTTRVEWSEISDGFLGKWQLPNALGAIDGKHIEIRAPSNSGSLYYNYKQYFSTVILVVADHRSRIIYAHFGSYGRESDAGIFDRSDFRRLISDPANPLDLPAASPLPGGRVDMPFYFIGDGAFPLQLNIMQPFAQRDLGEEKRVYNYRISRGRRVVESTFGIMASKWRILLKPIETSVAKADNIIKCICALHNFLIAEDEAGQSVTEEDMHYADQLKAAQMRAPMANHAPHDATNMREALVEYFNGVGSVEWQWEMI